MDKIFIRPARPEDGRRVTELTRQLGYEATAGEIMARIEKVLGENGAGVFVAEAGEMVAGWIQVNSRMTIESGDIAEITGLVVDEAMRGRGIGKSLEGRAEEWAKERGYGAIRVRTNVTRADAHRFYESIGFRETKSQKVYGKKLS